MKRELEALVQDGLPQSDLVGDSEQALKQAKLMKGATRISGAYSKEPCITHFNAAKKNFEDSQAKYDGDIPTPDTLKTFVLPGMRALAD